MTLAQARFFFQDEKDITATRTINAEKAREWLEQRKKTWNTREQLEAARKARENV